MLMIENILIFLLPVFGLFDFCGAYYSTVQYLTHYDKSTVIDYHLLLANHQFISEKCKRQVAETLNEFLLSNSSQGSPELYQNSYVSGGVREFWHSSHNRWMYSASSCQASAGGLAFTDTRWRWDYCHAHFAKDRKSVGVCVPSSCAQDDRAVLSLFHDTAVVHGNVSSLTPSDPPQCVASRWDKQWTEKPWAIIDLAYIVILWFVGFLASVYDRKRPLPDNKRYIMTRFWMCFSLERNFKNLAAAPGDPKSVVTCLFGIRFLSMVWTIVGHSYLGYLPLVQNHSQFVAELTESFIAQIITNFTLSVDTFFLLSGCMTAFSFFRRLSNVKGEDQVPSWTSWGFWLGFYRHRLVRLLPAYCYVMFTVIFRYSVVHYAQLWPYMDPYYQCVRYWWQNLLFLNSILGPKCMIWTWYLANDLIYYLISPVFLLALKDKPRIGVILCVSMCILSSLCRLVITLWYDLPPVLNTWKPTGTYNPDFVTHMGSLYMTPHTRAGPYFIGILFGYGLLNIKKIKVPVYCQVLGWSLSFVLGFGTVFGAYPSFQGWRTPIYDIAYATFFRSLFSISVAWLIFACYTGHARIINCLLSMRCLIPLANLSYVVYLFHVMPTSAFYLWMPFPVLWKGHVYHSLIVIGQICLSYVSGVIQTMISEQPALNIERLFINLRRNKGAERLQLKNKLSPPMETLLKKQNVVQTNMNDNKVTNCHSDVYV